MIAAFQKIKMPPLWARCVIASLALHSAGLYVVLQHPVLLKQTWASLFSPSQPLPKHIAADEGWAPDTLVLEHFFEEFPAPPKKASLSNILSSLSSAFPIQEVGEEITLRFSPSFLLREHYLVQTSGKEMDSLIIPQEEESPSLATIEAPSLVFTKAAHAEASLHSIYLGEKEVSRPIIQDILVFAPFTPVKESIHTSPLVVSNTLILEESLAAAPIDVSYPFTKPQESSSTEVAIKPFPHFLQDAPVTGLSAASLSEINDYLPEELISAIEWNHDFDVKATLFPEQDGYVFSLAVAPKQDFKQQRIKQNFYFLIDVSADVENHKLSVFKRSVLKALSALQAGDSFNVFLLDKKTTKLSASNLIVSPQNLLKAEDFLEKKTERPLFSSLDLRQGLNHLLGSIETDDEVHTAILLSNGKSSLDPDELQTFIKKNHGKLNLFTAAAGQNNRLTSLDMLSSFCGGSLFYSDTNASFPRKLALFVKSLESPLAKNLTLSLNASHPKANLQCSIPTHMPNLYNKEPFVIVGKIDRLCDLHLVLQGNSAEDQIFLRKVVQFEEAAAPESTLKKQWLLQQKITSYEKFLKDPNPVHLNKAKAVLRSVHGKAFEE